MLTLLETQKWFAGIITQPLQADENLPKKAPSGREIEEETKEYILPSPTLKPYERMQLYYRQYWWRLLKCLHENYPLVTRLFGYNEFNHQIGIPYLSACPPTHWALCRLGDTLPAWVSEHYEGSDRDLIALAAVIDWSAQESFWAPTFPPLTGTPEERMTKPVQLQPHIHLFALEADLFSFREAFVTQDIDYWTTHPFPKLEVGEGYFAVYRNPDNVVSWKRLSYGEYRILRWIQEGKTIEEACTSLEEEGISDLDLSGWFYEWTLFQWLAEK